MVLRRSWLWLDLACLALCFHPCGLGAPPLSIAHRGDSLFAPENTCAAFASALGKADLVELDARVSSDGQWVVMHDETVGRTTDGSGAVASLSLARLKQLDAGSWFSPGFAGERVPTLAEALAVILPAATPLVEVKAGTAAAFVAELERLGAITNVVVQSFDWNFLSAVHARRPDIRLGALGSGTLTASALASITNAGAQIVAWEKSGVTANEAVLARAAGLALYVWTVDGPEILNFLELGVDGIISNDPGMVRALQQPAPETPANFREGLVAYWSLDDGLTDLWATNIVDRVGGNSARLARKDGLSHWLGPPAAQFGGCLSVDGANAYAEVPNTPALNLNTNQLTLSAWVKLRRLPSQLAESFEGIFDSTTDAYVLYLDKANRELRFKVTTASGQAARPGIGEAFLRANEWLHVAATFNGQAGPAAGQAAIYLDGVPRDVHTGSDGGGAIGLTDAVKPGQVAAIGRNGTQATYYFTGQVDELALWSHALSPAEIRILSAKGRQGAGLGDLLRQPTALIQLAALRRQTEGNVIEIVFRNDGPWQSFSLLSAATLDGPFCAVTGIAPSPLGNGQYRFNYAPGAEGAQYFRIGGQ